MSISTGDLIRHIITGAVVLIIAILGLKAWNKIKLEKQIVSELRNLADPTPPSSLTQPKMPRALFLNQSPCFTRQRLSSGRSRWKFSRRCFTATTMEHFSERPRREGTPLPTHGKKSSERDYFVIINTAAPWASCPTEKAGEPSKREPGL